MGEQQKGTARASASVSHHPVGLARNGAPDEDAGFRKSRSSHALGGGLRNRRGRAGGETRLHLYHLLVDLARELLIGVGGQGGGRESHGGAGESRQQPKHRGKYTPFKAG